MSHTEQLIELICDADLRSKDKALKAHGEVVPVITLQDMAVTQRFKAFDQIIKSIKQVNE